MKLEQALAHRIAFGPWEGQTLGWIAKFEPEGVSWLNKMFWNGKVGPETREALRTFFAAPKLQKWLTKKLGGPRRHDQSSYLLPPSGVCRCCAASLLRLCSSPPQCRHGLARPYTETATCSCGYVEVSKVRSYVTCEDCDSAPLFSRLREQA